MEHVLNLFLDDERFPPSDGRKWIIARSMVAAQNVIQILGPPDFMSLDHDLGNGPTGYDFTKWFVDYLLDTGYDWNGNFYVHSQNPIGRENMKKLLDNLVVHRV